MNGVIKALVTLLLLVHVIGISCLLVPKHSNMLRTARGTIKMSIFDAGNKASDEILKIEHGKLKLKERELEIKEMELNNTKEVKAMELNNTKEVKAVELSNTIEMKMMELSNTIEVKMMELNSNKEIHMMELNNKMIRNAISVFAIVSFLIFSVQLRDGLLGKITTLTSLLQSFYNLGISIKTLMGKVSAKIYLSVAIIVTLVVVVTRTDRMLKGLYGTWHIIHSKALLIIRRKHF